MVEFAQKLKTVTLIAGVALLVVACGEKKTETTTEVTVPAADAMAAAPATDTAATDAMAAANSADAAASSADAAASAADAAASAAPAADAAAVPATDPK